MTMPLPRPVLIALVPATALMLAGCKAEVHDKDGNSQTASISFGNSGDTGNDHSVSIDVPGFSAKMNVPDLNLASDTDSIDGMKFFPGTKLQGVKIVGAAGDGSGGESNGDVNMPFTAPGTPDAVIGYYKAAAPQAGWTIVPPAGGEQFAATKPSDHGSASRFALQVGAGAGGASGVIHVSGSGE